MTTITEPKAGPATAFAPRPASVAGPSAFPPIADYAFLSDCHTGALVAPDGSVDWLCVPSLRLARACSAALLDQRGRHLPARPVRDQRAERPALRARHERARRPPGSTPSGLGDRAATPSMIGPSHGVDAVTPHTRPPVGRRRRARAGADGRRASRARSRSSWSASPRSTTAPSRRGVDHQRRRRARRRRRSSAAPHAAAADGLPASGIEGNRVRARRVLHAGETMFCSLSWAADLAGPATSRGRGRRRSSGRPRFWRDVAGPRPHPRPPLERRDPAVRADDQGR